MCTGSTGGDIGVDVLGGVADVATSGALTPELVGLVGSQMGQVAQQDALNKQNSIAAQNILQQGQLNKQAEGDVGTTIKQIAAANPTSQTAKVSEAEDQALAAGAQASAAAQPNTPGASKEFKAAQAGATNTAQDYIGNIKQGIAGTQAPALQRIGESQQIAGTAANLGLLGQQSQRENYVSNVQEQSVQQNPWLTDVGTLMQGVGAGMGAYQGFTGGNVPWESAGNATSTNPWIQALNGYKNTGSGAMQGTANAAVGALFK